MAPGPRQPCPVRGKGRGAAPTGSSGGCGGTSVSLSPSPADLDKLLSDLRSFLLLLDRESLSAAARAKKSSVSALLARLQGPPAGAARVSPTLRSTPPHLLLHAWFGVSPTPRHPRAALPVLLFPAGSGRAEAEGGRGRECLHGANQEPSVPPAPPADDSYEDAEPPGHGRTG
ncbi:hypothetical protein DV515_00019712, partial [Chloebia gouldiae]